MTRTPAGTAARHTRTRRAKGALIGGLAALALTACTIGEDDAPARPPAVGAAAEGGTEINPMLTSLDLASIDTHFDDNDLTWEAAEEQTITLDDAGSTSDSDAVTVDGSTVTIAAAGVYRISGSLSDGQVVVDEPNDEAVHLILDGVNITNSAGSAIALKAANEVTIVLEEGSTNAVADGSDYTVADDSTPVGAIASDVDLTIGGSGSLSVTGNTNDAITSRNGLVIASGTITATAADDGIRGQHYLAVLDGTIEVTSGGDALKSDEYEDQDRGWLLISGGTVTANAGDDGVEAEQAVQITAGSLTVAESVEGIEAQTVMLDGGTVNVQASDDGINSTFATTAATADGSGGDTRNDDGSVIMISGGTITVQGGDDGLDSNGSIAIRGGEITITSPEAGRGTGPVDANGPVSIENVTINANGRDITSADDL